ncbi:DNA polymerase III subunit gamma/tau [Shewanella sp. GXUN23E]|uniref:DNA polymerase III subunit gamma/tau n=1 Tax=Shewanella sp. GXUN23E TaxID=3422498 RepID=UPI003D7EEAA4
MSYQVLARKWRPANFDQVVGQSHVLHALTNALSQQRLHHAYLFTGTRGVGKTSLARLFAKGLNCETGVTANPCGQCASCIEIAQGRFVDLIEVDAASRTKVDDTRELLDNVQYRPTRGRYKVYLIDEVHMLSRSSFNALLKTLEEPPEHVKFLLATTDPQKLPVTVLSRCLQFNLKSLSQEDIAGQLHHVLTEEQLPFEPQALTLLAKSANGSMRDALSLTDQAIAFGAGQVMLSQVQTMLGTIDEQQVIALLGALLRGDVAQLMHLTAQILSYGADADEVLRSLLELLHQITLTQFAPAAAQLSLYAEQIKGFASVLKAEQIQLYYQILLTGRKDLPHAPDPKSGLEMALLRAVAFLPEPVAGHWTPAAGGSHSPGKTEPAGGTTGTEGDDTSAQAVSQPALQLASQPASPAMVSIPSASTTQNDVETATRPECAPNSSDELNQAGIAGGEAVTDAARVAEEETPAPALDSQCSWSSTTVAHTDTQIETTANAQAVSDSGAEDDIPNDAALLAEQALLLSQAQSLGYGEDDAATGLSQGADTASEPLDTADGAKPSQHADANGACAQSVQIEGGDMSASMASAEDDLAAYEQYFMGDMDAEPSSLPVDMQEMQFVPADDAAPAPLLSRPAADIGLDDDFLDAILAARDSLLAGLQTDESTGAVVAAQTASTGTTAHRPSTVDAPTASNVSHATQQQAQEAEHEFSAGIESDSEAGIGMATEISDVVSNTVTPPMTAEHDDASCGYLESLQHTPGRAEPLTAFIADEDRPPWEDAPIQQVVNVDTLPAIDDVFSGQFRAEDDVLSTREFAGKEMAASIDTDTPVVDILPAVRQPELKTSTKTGKPVNDTIDGGVLTVAGDVQGHALDLHWYKQMSGLKIGGRVRQLAVNSICLSWGEQIALLLKPDQKHLAAASAIEQLKEALGELAGMALSVTVEVGQDAQRETPREVRARFHQELLVAARTALHDDDNIRWLTQVMGAQLDDDSVVYPGELLSIKGRSIPELGSQ